ncbi:MAG: glycoside hydrolase family 28 protein [Bacteroidota bacterium]
MRSLRFSIVVLILLIASWGYCKDYSIAEFGAINDGQTLNTLAVQKAIDACTSAGGGRVLVDGGGVYIIGTIYLKSNVTLHIANGTTLQGSTKLEDYSEDTHGIMYRRESHMDRCLIYAENVNSIAIEGYGTIDGNGFPENFSGQRPMLLRFKDCKRIHLNDVQLINPAAWTSAFLYCDDISVSGITIISRANKNGDGLDFDGCTNVRVTNSNFDNSDDSICLQASLPEKPCRDITVSNCIFSTKWGGIRIGLLSRGDIEHVTVTNCIFKNIDDSGLKIQQCEGGKMSHMTFSNLTMRNVPRPIFMTFASQRAARNYPKGTYEPLDRMHNFNFDNIVIDNSQLDMNSAFFITGMPEHKIEDVSISNVQFTISGEGTLADAQKVVKEYNLETLKGHWPEFGRVGTLPAFGFYVRHVEGLFLDNINIELLNADARPAVILNDVQRARLGLMTVNNQDIPPSQIVKK